MTRPDSKEVIGTVGLVLIVAGVTRWSLTAAMILAGTMLFGYALLTARGAAPKKESPTT